MPKKVSEKETKEYIAEEDLLYDAPDSEEEEEMISEVTNSNGSLVLVVFLCCFLPIAGFVAGVQYMNLSVVPDRIVEAVQPLDQAVRQLEQDKLELGEENFVLQNRLSNIDKTNTVFGLLEKDCNGFNCYEYFDETDEVVDITSEFRKIATTSGFDNRSDIIELVYVADDNLSAFFEVGRRESDGCCGLTKYIISSGSFENVSSYIDFPSITTYSPTGKYIAKVNNEGNEIEVRNLETEQVEYSVVIDEGTLFTGRCGLFDLNASLAWATTSSDDTLQLNYDVFSGSLNNENEPCDGYSLLQSSKLML